MRDGKAIAAAPRAVRALSAEARAAETMCARCSAPRALTDNDFLENRDNPHVHHRPLRAGNFVMKRAFQRIYEGLVIERPALALILLLLLLAAVASGVPKFRLDASADSLLLESDPDLKLFRDLAKRYRSREFLFMTVTPKQALLGKDSLSLIRALRDELKALATVESVTTVLDVPLVKNVSGGLTKVVSNYRTVDAPDLDAAKALDELTHSPLYRNMVVSADGKTTAIRITLKPPPDNFAELQYERGELLYRRAQGHASATERDRLGEIEPRYQALKDGVDAANHATVEQLRAVMRAHSDTAELHLGGVAMIADDMIGYVRSDIVVFGTASFLLTIAMLGYIFREFRWVVIPVLNCAFITLGILGVLGLVGWKLTVISSNFLALTLILAISINIHLIVRYRELYRERPELGHRDLVRETARDMASPCLYTSLTSIIGFGSLLSSDIRPIADFGAMMAMSLLLVYFVVFTLVPALMIALPTREPRVDDDGQSGFTVWLARITDRHGTGVMLATLAIVVVSGIGISKLEVENSFINYFRKHTEIYQGLKRVDETLGGTTPLEVVLKFPSTEVKSSGGELDAEMFGDEPGQKSDTWFTADKIERIKKVHDYVAAVPGVGTVMSLASIVRVAEDLNKGREFDPFELNVIYKRLPANLRDELLTPYINIEADEARISLRILDSTPHLRRQALLKKINEGLQHDLGLKPEEFEVAGLLVLYNNMLQSLYSSQISSIGSAMVGVLLTLWFLFRNLRAAIIGLVPNIVAAGAVLGYMGWAGVPLDMMTIMVAALTMGIAVEDCIHYLYRYRMEFYRLGDGLTTMYHCHGNIARAGFYTTLVVCVGFSILMLSNFTPSILFGLLTTIAMGIAILAALTLMPKLLLMWQPFKLPAKPAA